MLLFQHSKAQDVILISKTRQCHKASRHPRYNSFRPIRNPWVTYNNFIQHYLRNDDEWTGLVVPLSVHDGAQLVQPNVHVYKCHVK